MNERPAFRSRYQNDLVSATLEELGMKPKNSGHIRRGMWRRGFKMTTENRAKYFAELIRKHFKLSIEK